MAYQPSKEEKATLDLFLKCLGKAEERHKKRCQDYDRRHETYLGTLKQFEGDWHSQLHPPYAGQYIETLLAMVCDEHPRSTVLPTSADDVKGAESLTKLIEVFRKKDNFDESYYLWVKQMLIMGLSPAKIDWAYQRRTIPQRKFYRDFFGRSQTSLEVKVVSKANNPRFTWIPVHDFLWDPAARTQDDMRWCFHRTYATLAEVKALGKKGPDGEEPLYQNTEHVSVDSGDTGDNAGGMFPKPDTRDRVEILEYWSRDRLITVASRSIVLRDEPNPFWHGELPFVVATTMPDLFGLAGRSEIEIISDLQKARWEFLNQRIDNAKFMNNFVLLVDENTDDLDKFKIEPGALIGVRNPDQIQQLQVNHNILKAGLESEQALAKDMSELTGAVDYVSGSADGTVDQTTATGISLVSSMAQKRIVAKRKRVFLALRRKGLLEIALIQQFIDKPTTVRLDAENSQIDFGTFLPEDIAGEYDYDIEDAGESLNRQEKRQEALNLFTTMLQAAPILAQFGTLINMGPFVETLLDAFDKKGLARYIQSAPQPAIPGLPAGGGAPVPGQPQVGPGPGVAPYGGA